MKTLLIVLLLFFKCLHSNAQYKFSISGKTNLIKNGKAVLLGNTTQPLYSLTTQADTVVIDNYAFQFNGIISYPEQHRIEFIDKGRITEPFFIDTGYQQLFVDTLEQSHDVLDFGIGVKMFGSKATDEYYKNYLPRFEQVNIARNSYLAILDKCEATENILTRKACYVHLDSVRSEIKNLRDSILYSYALQNSNSSIIPWLIHDALWYNGYKNLYQKAFNQAKDYFPKSICIYLESYLATKKKTALGSNFPVNDYIKSKVPTGYPDRHKYTLIDFWFAKCRPCFAQFELLRSVYSKHSTKGFELIAISVDQENSIAEYQKVLSQKNYPWQQILDIGGMRTQSLEIKKYPTNFLVDRSGIIVAIDINPYVLEKLLDEQL